MDTVRIRGLKAETTVGIHDWEKRVPRPVVVDLELSTDVARAAKSDAIGDALDSSAIAETVTSFLARS